MATRAKAAIISNSPYRFDEVRLADDYVASSELSRKFQAGANYPEFSGRADIASCQRSREFRNSENCSENFRNGENIFREI